MLPNHEGSYNKKWQVTLQDCQRANMVNIYIVKKINDLERGNQPRTNIVLKLYSSEKEICVTIDYNSFLKAMAT